VKGAFKFNSILDYHNAYMSGKITPEQVAKAVLDATKQSDSASSPLLAIIQKSDEEILRLAKESTSMKYYFLLLFLLYLSLFPYRDSVLFLLHLTLLLLFFFSLSR